MRIPASIRALLVACPLLLAAVAPCRPQAVAHPQRAPHTPRDYERILDFHSDITIQENSSLRVTETIDVIATGNQIRHGIFREFPTRYTDAFNNKHVVGFEMLAATCDSADEPFRVEDYSNGKRIYLGDPNFSVQPG